MLFHDVICIGKLPCRVRLPCFPCLTLNYIRSEKRTVKTLQNCVCLLMCMCQLLLLYPQTASPFIRLSFYLDISFPVITSSSLSSSLMLHLLIVCYRVNVKVFFCEPCVCAALCVHLPISPPSTVQEVPGLSKILFNHSVSDPSPITCY